MPAVHKPLWRRRLEAILLALLLPTMVVSFLSTFGLLMGTYGSIFHLSGASPLMLASVLAAVSCALAWAILYTTPYLKTIKQLWKKHTSNVAPSKPKGKWEKIFHGLENFGAGQRFVQWRGWGHLNDFWSDTCVSTLSSACRVYGS